MDEIRMGSIEWNLQQLAEAVKGNDKHSISYWYGLCIGYASATWKYDICSYEEYKNYLIMIDEIRYSSKEEK